MDDNPSPGFFRTAGKVLRPSSPAETVAAVLMPVPYCIAKVVENVHFDPNAVTVTTAKTTTTEEEEAFKVRPEGTARTTRARQTQNR